MKINYIVNINLDDKSARAIQVSSNAKIFYKELNDDFKLITAGKEKRYTYHIPIWVNNIKEESSKLRKFLFHTGSIKYILNSDIVYSRNLSVLYIASLFGKKIVWEMHDSLSSVNLKIFNKIRNKVKIVAISNALNRYLKTKLNYDKEVLVAHDGVFLDKYNKLRNIPKEHLRKELKLPLDKIIVMHTGSLYEGRGAELFEIIIKNFPKIYFVQVGGSEEYVRKWENYYRGYKNIKIIGHQNNEILVKYQMSADLLFLPMTKKNPIWWCTSPMKLFEYMATGIPILASNIGSVGEILTPQNAIIFNPDEKASIVNGIKWFLHNREKAQKLANNALKDVREKYTWEIRVKKILEFIR